MTVGWAAGVVAGLAVLSAGAAMLAPPASAPEVTPRPEPVCVCPETPPVAAAWPNVDGCLLANVRRVINGNTMIVDLYLGLDVVLQRQRIRLPDAFVPSEADAGLATTSAARAFVDGCDTDAGITVCGLRRDLGRRVIGSVHCGQRSLAGELVAAGLAKASAR